MTYEPPRVTPLTRDEVVQRLPIEGEFHPDGCECDNCVALEKRIAQFLEPG